MKNEEREAEREKHKERDGEMKEREMDTVINDEIKRGRQAGRKKGWEEARDDKNRGGDN